MTDLPRTRAYPVQVSVPGTRTDDGTACTLLAIRETTGTWMIYSLHAGAVRLTDEEATGLAKGILHLVGARAGASRGPAPTAASRSPGQ